MFSVWHDISVELSQHSLRRPLLITEQLSLSLSYRPDDVEVRRVTGSKANQPQRPKKREEILQKRPTLLTPLTVPQ